MTKLNNKSGERRTREGILLLVITFALWAAGCAHDNPRNSVFAGGGMDALVPKLTSVTTWPLALLLTNGQAYEAEFTMTLGGTEPPVKLSGQLLVRGGKLRLEGAFDKSNPRFKRTGDFGVIWDEAAHQGYVFSEAMQGYAPVSVMVRCTNLVTQVMAGKTERIEGHPVDKANATVMGSDGQTITVALTRAQDLGNLPLKIDSLSGSQAFALALSNIQALVPGEELFSPPDGFTKYQSQTAMLEELTSRQLSVTGGKHERIGKGDSDEPTQTKPRFSGTQ